MKPARKHRNRRGMTLMEVVIAIGIVAFVIPVILTMIASSGDSLRNSEADTRSVWIAREVQREVFSKWAEPQRESVITESLAFPAFSSEASPLILAYDAGGKFLAEGTAADIAAPSNIPGANYLVAVHGESHAAPDTLSLLRIRVLHPAKSPPTKRSQYRYNLITTRQGPL